MKFINEITPKGFQIPSAAMKIGGFQADGKVEYRIREKLITVLPQRMTAMDLLKAAEALEDLAVELYCRLAEACGPCEDCDGECPYKDELDVSGIELPDFLRQEAGIPADAKLWAEVDEARHRVTISEADYRYDLRDLPKEILEMFADAGVCLEDLEEHLMTEDVVYGG